MEDNAQRKFKSIEKGVVEARGGSEPWNYSEEYWKNTLRQIPEFHGDINKASQILVNISGGIKATKDKLQQKGLISFTPPMLIVAYGERAERMSALHNVDENTDAVLVGVYFLSNLSRLNFNRIGYFSRDDGVNFFHGYVKDFAFLMGVEEAHHSSFQQFKKNPTPSVEGSSVPLEEYDAIEHEFRALLFQRRMAEEKKMPRETVSFLDKRIEAAKKVRELGGGRQSLI